MRSMKSGDVGPSTATPDEILAAQEELFGERGGFLEQYAALALPTHDIQVRKGLLTSEMVTSGEFDEFAPSDEELKALDLSNRELLLSLEGDEYFTYIALLQEHNHYRNKEVFRKGRRNMAAVFDSNSTESVVSVRTRTNALFSRLVERLPTRYFDEFTLMLLLNLGPKECLAIIDNWTLRGFVDRVPGPKVGGDSVAGFMEMAAHGVAEMKRFKERQEQEASE